MRLAFSAVFALITASSLDAQNADLSHVTPLPGSWTYSATADGSDASFNDTASHPQLWMHCTRATHRVTISKSASVAAPQLNVWTSSQSRNVLSSFNPATGRLSIDLAAYDPLLDAIASSRGRIGFSMAGQTALVLPTWGEAAHVIEDCRV